MRDLLTTILYTPVVLGAIIVEVDQTVSKFGPRQAPTPTAPGFLGPEQTVSISSVMSSSAQRSTVLTTLTNYTTVTPTPLTTPAADVTSIVHVTVTIQSSNGSVATVVPTSGESSKTAGAGPVLISSKKPISTLSSVVFRRNSNTAPIEQAAPHFTISLERGRVIAKDAKEISTVKEDLPLPTFSLEVPTSTAEEDSSVATSSLALVKTTTVHLTTAVTATATTTTPTTQQDSAMSVHTTVISADSRCPYPYPGIYCGTDKTTLVTETVKPTTTEMPKKTGSACPFLYPGQKSC